MAASYSHTLLLLVLLLAGCTKPGGDYFFVSTRTARTQGDRYDFTLNLDDTTCTYTVRMAARLVASRIPDRQVAFDIRFSSPVGETTIERKSFSIADTGDGRRKAGSGSVMECEWLWRDTIRISGAQTGNWHISIAPVREALFEAIYGIGISYENDHGKR